MGKRKTVIIGADIEEETKKKKPKEKKIEKKKPLKEQEEGKVSLETKEEQKPETKEKPKKKSASQVHRIKRSKNYQKAQALIEKGKNYSLEEALDLIEKISFAKFDETVELHLRLGIDPKKTEEAIRGTVVLPHGLGKEVKIGAIVSPGREKEAQKAGVDVVGSSEMIEKIKKGIIDFDVLIATPDMMSKIAEVAKILGPKGLMPNPKSGTVGMEIEKMVKEIKQGKVEIKTDKDGNLHLPVGKVSFGKEKLKENLAALMEVVLSLKPEKFRGEYIKTATLTTTMGPAIKINPLSLLRK